MQRFVVACAIVLMGTAFTPAQPGGFPGGFPGGPPGAGQIVPPFLAEQLKLTDEQKKTIDALQAEVDARLNKIWNEDQKKQWKEMKAGPTFPGPGGRGPGGRGPGGPGGFGPPDGMGFPGGPGAATERLDDVKKYLSATDEEWKVIGPKLQKIVTLRQSLMSGTGNVSQAQEDLKAVLKSSTHSKAEREEALSLAHKARQKARAELDVAQKDLRLLLTEAQQAILMGLGYLDEAPQN